MRYPRCPTCKTLLADKYVPYNTESEKIRENPKLNESEKNAALKELPTKLGLKRYCCKPRLQLSTDISAILV